MIQIPFQQWFSFNYLIGGDWRFFWPENLKEILSYSYAWDQSLNNGMGQSNIIILWLNSYLSYSTYFLNQVFLIPWGVAEKIIFFWPIILVSFLSAFFLSRKYIPSLSLNVTAGILYLTNTYALMIFSGGQVGIGLAYSFIPFLLLASIFLFESLEKTSKILLIRNSLIVALILSIEMLLEPRITLISLMAISLYFTLHFLIIGIIKIKRLIFSCLFIGIIVALIHSFWILPLVFVKESLTFYSLEKAANSQFLSFANFSDSLSLLHPNWPENIFGKVYFMRPEFLLLPILTFCSLLFIPKIKDHLPAVQAQALQAGRTKTYVLFLALLGIVGAFLAKGTNPPFGQVYTWLSDSVPGFVAFRDPTKWYMLIALSYSILLPISLYEIRKVVISYINKRFGQGILVFFLIFWIFSIRQAFIPGLPGTFKDHKIPQEYSGLARFLEEQPSYFRTLWIPQFQRFGYFSNNHPAIGREELLKGNARKQILQLNQNLIKDFSVKYIIVPYDSQGEIFLKDRKYDDVQYLKTIEYLNKIPWLKRVERFGKIAVFEVPNPKDHFWTTSNTLSINYQYVSPVEYQVEVINAKVGDQLIFSESYGYGWTATAVSGIKYRVASIRHDGRFNSFVLEKDGNYTLNIYYEPQEWVNIGLWISGTTLLIVVGYVGFGYISKRW